MAGPASLTSGRRVGCEQASTRALAPLTLCVGAGFVSAFAPVLVWRLETGDWVCLKDWDTSYYLRFVAQAYCHRALHISDVVVPGGVAGYPWLPFVPAVYAARVLDAGPFAVELIWIFLSAIGLSAGLYFVFRHFLERPWPAAGCTIVCLADFGLADRPCINQLEMLASALWLHPKGLVAIPWGFQLHWRVPDPGLGLPLMLFQILALARARERPTRLNVWLSGSTFGLLFYVFFYCWTMAMMGLGIAFLLDRGAHKAYGLTLCVGSAIGLPQLIYTIHLAHLASPEAISRLGLFTPAPRLYQESAGTPFLLAMAAVALWIRKSKRFDLVYPWSLAVGGILLSRSRVVSGIFFHEYHYTWLSTPICLALVLIVAVSIAHARFRWRPVAAPVCWTAVMLYFAGGIYLAVICVTRTSSGVHQVRSYTLYKLQRLATGVEPLVAGQTIAGDDIFCELAAVAEYQWVLGGQAVPISMAVDNEQWESREALNAYLVGKDRGEFEKEVTIGGEYWFWENPTREREVNAAFMRKYDEVVRAPRRFIARFGVRYVAFAADRAPMGYLREGWTMLQRGPYWQLWERTKSDP